VDVTRALSLFINGRKSGNISQVPANTLKGRVEFARQAGKVPDLGFEPNSFGAAENDGKLALASFGTRAYGLVTAPATVRT